MKPEGLFPAVEKAMLFVRYKIDKGVWHEGDRLPSIQQLAVMADVSPATMFKAITVLRKKRLVNGSYHHRINVGAKSPAKPLTDKKLPHWEPIRALVEKDLNAGMFGIGTRLPTVKELQVQYGVCFTTMRKILHALISEGILQPQGRGYLQAGHQSRHIRRRIVFIFFKGALSQQSALSQPNNRLVNQFENESLRMGLNLETVEIDFYDSVETRRRTEAVRNDDSLVGLIIQPRWNVSESFRQAGEATLAHLCTFKKPITLLDDVGEYELPDQFVRNPLVQVYRLERERAGERMAQLLSGLGHRSIAYISPLHYAPWARERFDGIQKKFLRAGYADSVSLVANMVGAVWPSVLTATGLKTRDIRELMIVGNSPAQIADLEKVWAENMKVNRPPYAGIPRLSAASRDYLTRLVAFNRKETNALFIGKTYGGALDGIAEEGFERQVQELCDRAVKLSGVTGWICANDETAVRALAFLHAKGIRVPQDISVAGFDNVPVTALAHKLTTFDFNALGFIHHMLNFIVRPPRPRGTYRHAPIEVEGMIMVRGTTGKPRSTRT